MGLEHGEDHNKPPRGVDACKISLRMRMLRAHLEYLNGIRLNKPHVTSISIGDEIVDIEESIADTKSELMALRRLRKTA